jgi:hypothetical protein
MPAYDIVTCVDKECIYLFSVNLFTFSNTGEKIGLITELIRGSHWMHTTILLHEITRTRSSAKVKGSG